MFRDGKPRGVYIISVLILTVFMLSSCAKTSVGSAEFYAGAYNAEAKANYRTALAVEGRLSRGISLSLEAVYSYKITVFAQEAGVRYVPQVKRGDSVSEGGVIALIYRDVSFSDVEKARLAYERALEQRDLYEASAASVPGRQGELALIEFRLNYSRGLEMLETEYRKLLSYYEGPEEVLAPFDAYVNDVHISGDKSVDAYEPLMTLSKIDSLILFNNSSSSFFNFGMPVTVEYGDAQNRKTARGYVSSTDLVVSENGLAPLNNTYVSLDEPVPYEELKNVSARAELVYTGDTVMVPLSAVSNDKGKPYVNILDDSGIVHKRYIIKGVTGGDPGAVMVQVLSGLEAGQTVILG